MADEAASTFRTQTSYDADPVFLMHRGGKIGVEPTVEVPDRAALGEVEHLRGGQPAADELQQRRDG